MVISRVKRKFPALMLLIVLAVVTALLSYASLLPASSVERGYARSLFPTISHMFGVLADAVPFSWLDVWILAGIALLTYGVRKRRWMFLAGAVSFFYLWFFWTWGLNYHRPLLTDRLRLQTKALPDSELKGFAETAAREINRLWPKIAPERWQQVDKAFGQWEMPVYSLVQYVIDNEVHHRGQGYVYLRALGIEPPPFYEREF
jgi:hypothetical protein